jgi:uncharacterized protein (DUF1330 family)
MAAWMLVLQKQHNTQWLRDYMTNVPSMIHKHGGRYLGVARRIIPIENALVEGGNPEMDIAAMFEFPSGEAIQNFMASEEYQPYAEARKSGSSSDIYILDDLFIPT